MTIPFFQDVLTTATAASLYLIVPLTQNFQSLPDSIHRNIHTLIKTLTTAIWLAGARPAWSHRRRIRRTPPALALCIKPRSQLHK
jgi:hypothetical protein